MTGLDTKTIEEITDTLIDYRGKTPPKATSGVKLITAKVIKDGFILDGNYEYIADSTYQQWMRRGFPEQWDILITTEAPLGEVAQLRTTEQVALAQRVILLRGKPGVIDQTYYFYALRSPYVQAELRTRSSGTTVAGIKQTELRLVKVPYHPLAVQRKIAAVLSAYDDLIESNTRRIQLLEEMARAIYREWFVNFCFPGNQHVKMVDSELGPVPEAWEVRRLDDLAQEVRRGANPDGMDPETPYVGLEHIPRKSIALTQWGHAREVQSTKLAFKKGAILFGKIRPYFHKVVVAPVDGICSSDTIVIAPRSADCFGLVLSCVSSEIFVEYASQTSQGTKMPRANWEVLKKYPIVVPPASLLREFNHLATEFVDLINNMIFRNHTLRQTRDLLLPRLISGDVDVSEVDILTQEAKA